MSDHFSFLRDVYFFRELSDEVVADIAKSVEEVSYPDATVIFREGDRADRFYIVIDGAVQVWKGFGSRAAELLAIHGTGHLFGEMALVDDMPRSATVVAEEGVRLLYLNREAFNSLLERDVQVAFSLMRNLSSMVRKSNESFVEDLRRRNDELERANRELKEAQDELLRAERLSNLGKFSSMIIHDIRNPLSVVRSYGEMVKLHRDEPERVERFAAELLRECDRLSALTAELLDYSRGEVRLRMSICNIDELFEKVANQVSTRFEQRDLRLDLRNEVSRPLILDEERMARVLVNLCENARAAMSPGGVCRLSAQATGRQVHITVDDDGRGMSDEVRSRIFEPFFSSSQGGGTGLGMVIVKNIVEAHEGTLSVASAPGEGTTVQISLPRRG